MIGRNVVDSLPDRELTEETVKQLEDHDRIDCAVVELTSTGTSYSDGSFCREMVEAFWISIDGTAHVLQIEHGEWVHKGTFDPDDHDSENVHRAAFEHIRY